MQLFFLYEHFHFSDFFRPVVQIEYDSSIYTVIFGFESLSVSILLKNEEKHVDILERKIICTEREKVRFIY